MRRSLHILLACVVLGPVGTAADLPVMTAVVVGKLLTMNDSDDIFQPGMVVMEAMTRYLATDPDPIYSRLKDMGNADYESLLWEATRARVSFYSLRAGHDISQAMRGAAEASTPRRISGVAATVFSSWARLKRPSSSRAPK